MWSVARREFIERVRSRWFVVATVLVPVLMVLLFAVPFLSIRGGTSEREIVVVDATERGLGPGLRDRLGTVNSPSVSVEVVPASHDQLGGLVDSLDILVSANLLHAYLIANDELLERGVLQYRSTAALPDASARLIAEFVRAELVAAELSRVTDDARLVLLARRALSLEAVELDDWQRSDGAGAEVLVLVYAVFFALYFAILIHGISVMGAVVEEKTSRVVEILLSSIGPSDLLAGKIIGVGSVGLLQLFIWAAAGKLLFAGPGWLAPTPATAGSLSLAGLSLGTELLFVVYFLLGYFLYAGLFATVAAISNSESDARQAQLPVVVILMVPALLLPAVVSDPHGSLATWLSIIPFSAPMMMPVRMVLGSVETSQVTVSILLTGAAVILAAWLAGRIYRVSVLAQGRRLRVRELINWIRTT